MFTVRSIAFSLSQTLALLALAIWFSTIPNAQGAIFWTEAGTGKIRVYENGQSQDVITDAVYPSGVAVDSLNRKIYWTDRGLDTIQRANMDGSNIETLVSSGLHDAFAIALDPAAGKMYWADAQLNEINRANLDGTSIETIVQTSGDPEGLAVDAVNGKIYWSNFVGRDIHVANLDGSGAHQLIDSKSFGELEGLALNTSANKLFFCDYGNGIIYQADLDGNNIVPLITSLDQPIGVAYDAARDKIVWVDSAADVLQEADSDGSNIITLENTNYPKGLAVASRPAPIFLVVDYNSNRIYQVDPDTGEQTIVSEDYPLSGPTEIVSSAEGRVFIANLRGDEILEYDPDTQLVSSFAKGGYLHQPIGIDFDAEGDLIVVNRISHSVIHIDLETGTQSLIAQGNLINNPFDVAVDQNGDLFVTNAGTDSIVKIETSSGNQSLITSGGSFDFPDDIIVLSDGRILVSDLGNGRIIEVHPDTGAQNVVVSGEFLRSPNSLTEMDSGELLVADGRAGLIQIDLDAIPFPTQTLISENGYFYAPEGATVVYGSSTPGYTAAFTQSETTLQEGSSIYVEIRVNYGPEDAPPAELNFSVEADDPDWLNGVYFDESEHVFPGENIVSARVRLSDDEVLNGTRSIRLYMTSATPSLHVGNNEFITIHLQDADEAGTIFFDKSQAVLHEGQGDLDLKIRRNINDPGTIGVSVRTVDGTATAGTDYQALDTLVTFPLGVYEQTVSMGGAPVTSEVKPLRDFSVELYNPGSGVTLGTPSVMSIDVNDKDDPGSLDPSFQLTDSNFNSRGSYLMEILSNGAIAANLRNSSTGLATLRFIFPGGNLDPDFAFAPGLYKSVNAMIELPDGKFLVGGQNLVGSQDVLRLHANGSVDSTFIHDPNIPNTYGGVNALLRLPDGKIIVASRYGCYDHYIYRIHPDGNLDSSFLTGIFTGNLCTTLKNLWLLPDGKILLAGPISTYDGHPGPVIRLNPDGIVDTSFTCETPQNRVTDMAIQADGKILLSSWSGTYVDKLVRLMPDGTLDESFQIPNTNSTGRYIRKIQCLPNGQVLVIGNLIHPDTGDAMSIQRLHPDGSVDTSFDLYRTSYPPSLYSLALAEDGSVYLSGSFSSLDGYEISSFARLKQPDIPAIGRLAMNQGELTVSESAGQVDLRVTRTGSSSGSVAAYYSTLFSGSADSDDFSSVSGTVTFSDGESFKDISVPLTNDGITEGVESFEMVLFGLTGGVLPGSPGRTSVSIQDASLTYTEWRALHYGSVTSQVGEPDYRPDHSSWTNFTHYSFGTDPFAFTSSQGRQPQGFVSQLASEGGNSYLQLSFYFSASSPGVRYDVEESTNLSQWTSIWNSIDDPNFESPLVVVDQNGDSGWITIRSDSDTSSTGHCFLRVRMSPLE